MIKPNFFIVGHPKSGTTSLYNYFNQHPDIFVPSIKEPHFFCTDFHDEANQNAQPFERFPFRSFKSYLDLYNKVNNEKVIVDISVFNLYSKVAAEKIFNFNPNAKILILLREPIDFILSRHNQSLKTSQEFEKDLKMAIDSYKDRKQGIVYSTTRFKSIILYEERIKYDEQVQRYLDYFNKDKVKVMFFEEFKRNPSNFCGDIFQYMQVNNHINTQLEHHNMSNHPRSLLLAKIYNLIFLRENNYINIISKYIPKKITNSVKSLLQHLVFAKGKNSCPKKTRKYIKFLATPHVKKLGIILGFPIYDYWYNDKKKL